MADLHVQDHEEKLGVGFIYIGAVGHHGRTYEHIWARLQVRAGFGERMETVCAKDVPEEKAEALEVIAKFVVRQRGTLGVPDLVRLVRLRAGPAAAEAARRYPDAFFGGFSFLSVVSASAAYFTSSPNRFPSTCVHAGLDQPGRFLPSKRAGVGNHRVGRRIFNRGRGCAVGRPSRIYLPALRVTVDMGSRDLHRPRTRRSEGDASASSSTPPVATDQTRIPDLKSPKVDMHRAPELKGER